MLYKLPLTITTLAPVILAELSGDSVMTGTQDFIPGSAVRGTLANEYISERGLREGAEEDEGFYRLFLSTAVRYLPAYPTDSKGRIAYPLPLTLYANKDKTELRDITADELKVGFKGYKGYGAIDYNAHTVSKVEVRKSIELHMSRQEAEERIIGSSQDGKIYNYEALEAGQKFAGVILGEKADLLALEKAFAARGNSFTTYCGRSKHTQYGKCKLELGKVEAVKPLQVKEANSKSLYIRFLTDYIPQDGSFATADAALEEVVDKIKQAVGAEVTIGKIYSTLSSQEGFVGIWGVKRETRRALSAGTVVELKKKKDEDLSKEEYEDWSKEEVERVSELGRAGSGLRKIDGFGYYTVYTSFVTGDVSPLAKVEKKKYVKPSTFAPEVKMAVKKVLEALITEHLQMLASEDIEQRLAGKNVGKHLFSRIEYIITQAKDKTTLKQAVRQAVREKSKTEQNLQKLRARGISLLEIFEGKYKSPYEEQWERIVTVQMQNLADAVGIKDFKLLDKTSNEIYYLYYLWYCRLARKNKGGKGGEK